ncbi:MAG: cell division protein FtsA [Patescibacteria group bacterium]
MARSIATGIDIGTTAVKTIVAEYVRAHDGPTRRIIGVGASEVVGLRHGYIVDREHISRSVRHAINQAEKTSRMQIRSALLSVGGVGLESTTTTGTSIVSRADSEITELDVERSLAACRDALPDAQKNNRKILHTIPLSYKLDGKEVLGRVLGMKGIKLEIKTLFVTALEQHVADLIEAVESAGVEVRDVVASPIASAVATLSKAQRIAGCVLVDIGSETVSLVVYENDMPISLKVFPIGSHDITKDIALGLRLPLDEAERVKVDGLASTTHSRKKLDEIVSARLKDIFELIDAHLKKLGRNGLLPAGIVLTGGGSRIADIEDLARAALAIPSRLGNIEINATAHGLLHDPSWTVAYGTALLGLSPGMSTGSDFSSLPRFTFAKDIGASVRTLFKKILP